MTPQEPELAQHPAVTRHLSPPHCRGVKGSLMESQDSHIAHWQQGRFHGSARGDHSGG